MYFLNTLAPINNRPDKNNSKAAGLRAKLPSSFPEVARLNTVVWKAQVALAYSARID